MARIVFGSYFMRYPQGGMMSHVLQYLVGLQRLGHEVYFVEKARYRNECYDPIANVVGDDCSRGIEMGSSLLRRFGLEGHWCFVDVAGTYHGLDARAIGDVFANAAAFIDMGTHGAWLDEAQASDLRVLIDGEPGFNQIKMEHGDLDSERGYDAYVTNGRNVGTTSSSAPTAGRNWIPIFHPVAVDMFEGKPPTAEQPFSTLMNWRSHDPIAFNGRTYGQKDVEFERFLDLPARVDATLELAVAGSDVPRERLQRARWRVRDGRAVSASFDTFVDYIGSSAAEFTVAKNVFVELTTGWFSDRSAAYLAAGRPVVMQDTGFSAHLPTGEGLFAVESVDDAATAVDEIQSRLAHHSAAARRIAVEYLDVRPVLGSLLGELGIASAPPG